MSRSPRRALSAWAREHQTLRGVLAELSQDPERAVREGRVFVAGRRVDRLDWPLRAGQRIDLRAARPAPPTPDLIDEHAGVIAACKPAGIATEPDLGGGPGCLLDAVARVLGVQPSELHALNRLDTNVSGVVLVARSAEARRWVEAARARADLRRRYVAIAWGTPAEPEGDWSGAVRTHRGGTPRPASTHYLIAARAARALAGRSASLLALEPRTGRTHQLRVHCASGGLPLLGDRAYGGPGRLVNPDGTVRELDRIALHAARVALRTPAGRIWTVRASVPEVLVEWWANLEGAPEGWARALEEGPT